MSQHQEERPWDKDINAPISPPVPDESEIRRKARIWRGAWGVFTTLVFGLLLWWLYQQGIIDMPERLAYRGSSTGLRQTTIVPALDSPMPADQNVIWCSSFQLAWNQARENLCNKSPILLDKALQVAHRLNASPASANDVLPENVYAAAGRSIEGISAKIRQDMARKFPDAPSSDLPPSVTDGLVTYAYLTSQVKFTIPFRLNRAPFSFTDSAGQLTGIRSFGILKSDRSTCYPLREQVKVLYRDDFLGEYHSGGPTEYALDLCRTSKPYQIVLAAVAPKATLADTLAALRKKMALMPAPSNDKPDSLGSNDELLIPEMRYTITHHFSEIEGNSVKNLGGMPILQAMQNIDFRLDRCGATISSSSWAIMGCIPAKYLFNHPFLLYITKRGAKTPFFVMWVDNSELIDK